MAKHWYRNEDLALNKLLDDLDIIPEGFSQEAYKKFQSEIHSGEKHNNWGKHLSEETKRKIGEGNRGKKVSKEAKQKMSESAKKRDYSNFHPDHRGDKNPRWGTHIKLSEESNKRFQERRYATMKKNNSFGKSKPEEDYYKLLVEQYGESDIIRQYKSERYPFMCDFYIISEDKFIECHYNWTHGGRPYVEDDEECIRLLNTWKSRTSGKDFYSAAIYTWTDLDVRKRKIAEENHLNIEFIYEYER